MNFSTLFEERCATSQLLFVFNGSSNDGFQGAFAPPALNNGVKFVDGLRLMYVLTIILSAPKPT
jgi:hypothetical protein